MKDNRLPLNDLDRAAAKMISAEYPADWDMSRCFRKSMDKYRRMKAAAAGDDAASVSDIEIIKNDRHISAFPMRFAAAPCLLIAGIVVGILLGIPDRNNELPDKPDKPPFSFEAVLTTETTCTVTTKISAQSGNKTSAAKTTVNDITTAAAPISTSEKPNEASEDAPAEEENEELVSAETAATTTSSLTHIILTGTETTSVSTSFTTTSAVQTEPVTTAATTTLTDRKKHPDGYFTVGKFYGSDTFIFVRNNDEDIELMEHTFDLEDISASSMGTDSYGTTVINIVDTSDETEIRFTLIRFPVEYFNQGAGSMTESYLDDMEFFEIHGKPACGKYSPGTYTLYWFDGCHINMMSNSSSCREKMLRIAENMN